MRPVLQHQLAFQVRLSALLLHSSVPADCTLVQRNSERSLRALAAKQTRAQSELVQRSSGQHMPCLPAVTTQLVVPLPPVVSTRTRSTGSAPSESVRLEPSVDKVAALGEGTALPYPPPMDHLHGAHLPLAPALDPLHELQAESVSC